MPASSEVAVGDVRALCLHLVQRLVSEPDEVTVTEEQRGDDRVLLVHVAAVDRGKVIGKGGRVVRALRTVVRAGVVKSGGRILVEVDAPDEPPSAPSEGDAAS